MKEKAAVNLCDKCGQPKTPVKGGRMMCRPCVGAITAAAHAARTAAVARDAAARAKEVAAPSEAVAPPNSHCPNPQRLAPWGSDPLEQPRPALGAGPGAFLPAPDQRRRDRAFAALRLRGRFRVVGEAVRSPGPARAGLVHANPPPGRPVDDGRAARRRSAARAARRAHRAALTERDLRLSEI